MLNPFFEFGLVSAIKQANSLSCWDEGDIEGVTIISHKRFGNRKYGPLKLFPIGESEFALLFRCGDKLNVS